jgi:hypothetical protein
VNARQKVPVRDSGDILIKSDKLCSPEIMGKDFFAGPALLCHAGGSDLAQAYAVAPSCTM